MKVDQHTHTHSKLGNKLTQYWLRRFGEEIKKGGGLKLSTAFLPPTSSMAEYSSPLPAIPLHGMENFADVTNYFFKREETKESNGGGHVSLLVCMENHSLTSQSESTWQSGVRVHSCGLLAHHRLQSNG